MEKCRDDILAWLMEGDVAIRWQVMRDLLGSRPEEWKAEKAKVVSTGWGARFLSQQDAEGTWGGGVYSPKWTSTTYTLLQLRDMGLSRDHGSARKGAQIVLDQELGRERTDRFWKYLARCDLCVVGMILELVIYFGIMDSRVDGLVNHLLEHRMKDGGWNCQSKKKCGVVHSSFHTTFNVLNGLRTYLECGCRKYKDAILKAEKLALELLLRHKLFRSDKTGEVINEKFLLFSYPVRWRYDVLRGLDYFQRAGVVRDGRLEEAIEILNAKQHSDGFWLMQNRHAGRTFFEMESVGKPSRWNTLRALRVLQWWGNSTPTPAAEPRS
jgi:hypothetical protein